MAGEGVVTPDGGGERDAVVRDGDVGGRNARRGAQTMAEREPGAGGVFGDDGLEDGLTVEADDERAAEVG